MDVKQIVDFLTPYLPFLLKMGEETGKAIAAKIGEDMWEKSKEKVDIFWGRIHPKAREDANLMQAAQDVAKAQEALIVLPQNADLTPASEELADYQRILARRLKALLDANPDLAAVAQTTVEQMVRIEGESGEIKQIAKRGGKVSQNIEVGPQGKTNDITQEA